MIYFWKRSKQPLGEMTPFFLRHNAVKRFLMGDKRVDWIILLMRFFWELGVRLALYWLLLETVVPRLQQADQVF